MFSCVMEVIVPDNLNADIINNVDTATAAEDNQDMNADAIDNAGDRDTCTVNHQITRLDRSSLL